MSGAQGQAMPIYRFYTIRKDGHIDRPAAQYDVADDAAAIVKAGQLPADQDIEIWLGARVVGYVRVRQTAPAEKPDAVPAASRV
jgi:hypothetical protein